MACPVFYELTPLYFLLWIAELYDLMLLGM